MCAGRHGIVLVVLLLTVVVGCSAHAPRQAGPLSTSGNLNGVAAASADSAWAVGFSGWSGFRHTLIVHWNGAAWKRVPSPTPRAGGELWGVAAASARDV